MAAIPIAVIESDSSGILITKTAANAGDGNSFDLTNAPNAIIYLENGDASPTTATFVTTTIVDGDLTVLDRAVVVAAGTEHAVGPFNPQQYLDTSNVITVTFSSVTSLTVWCVKPQIGYN